LQIVDVGGVIEVVQPSIYGMRAVEVARSLHRVQNRWWIGWWHTDDLVDNVTARSDSVFYAKEEAAVGLYRARGARHDPSNGCRMLSGKCPALQFEFAPSSFFPDVYRRRQVGLAFREISLAAWG
jgi:hypothetical protein